MANIPLSDVTLIASALGIFFLIVAFYGTSGESVGDS